MEGTLARPLLIAGFFVASSLILVAAPGGTNAGGAGAGWGDSGCNCHGTAPDLAVEARIAGLPDPWRAGTPYNVTVEVVGAQPPLTPPLGQNAGGFAFDYSTGRARPIDDKTQVVQSTVTHTDAGNDQRSWTFRWDAPEDARAVRFKISVLGANGDALNDELDAWNHAVLILEGAPTQDPTEETPSTRPGATPALGPFGHGVAFAAAWVLFRRR